MISIAITPTDYSGQVQILAASSSVTHTLASVSSPLAGLQWDAPASTELLKALPLPSVLLSRWPVASPAIGAPAGKYALTSFAFFAPLNLHQDGLAQIAPDPAQQAVRSISRWSSGTSRSLKFDAPLVAVVQEKNSQPASILTSTIAETIAAPIDDKGVGSIKGEAVSEETWLNQRDCLSAEEIAPKAAIPHVFEVQVRGQTIAQMPTQKQADELSQRIHQLLQQPEFDPTALKAVLIDGRPAGKYGDTLLFQIDTELATQFERNSELLAIAWINNLRKALGASTLKLVDAQVEMLALVATQQQLKGNASWYDPAFMGSPTATGEAFDPIDLTAAHPTLPFGTYLKVTNQKTQNSVIVRINDRGPFLEDRSLDVSGEAARCLNSEVEGVIPFQAVVMINPDSPPLEPTMEETSASPEALSRL
jgi:hypothetical protein